VIEGTWTASTEEELEIKDGELHLPSGGMDNITDDGTGTFPMMRTDGNVTPQSEVSTPPRQRPTSSAPTPPPLPPTRRQRKSWQEHWESKRAAAGGASSAPPPPPPHPEAATRPRTAYRSQARCTPVTELPADKGSQLVTLLDAKIEREVALAAIGASSGELRELAETFLLKRFSPPKPMPTNAKALSVKGQENILPVFQYPPSLAQSQPPGRVYTFLVVGETGAGKTTLLDAFANVLSKQGFSDKFRWKLVDENHMASKAAGTSMTSEVTYYYLWDERDESKKCHVRIIDTPGFGDTEGLDMDDQIVRKFQQLFSSGEIPDLDYVLVVVKASDSRDHPRVAYIHTRIQELFGCDAVGRFIVMCTFADGGDPICLQQLSKHLTWQCHFKFNNSALYMDPDKGGEWAKFFWNLGVDSVEKFLKFVVETSRTPMSMTLSRQVLQTRQLMQDQADGATLRISRGIAHAEYMHEMLKDMKSHEETFKANKNYTFTKKVNVPKQIPLGPGETAYQYCTTCNHLCCQSCPWPEYENGRKLITSPCTYFGGSKGCPVCKGCPRESHVRQKFKEITEEQDQVTVLDGKKNAYEAAQRGISNAQNAYRNQVEHMESLANDLLKDMQVLKNCRAELDRIAFKKVNHSNVTLFEQMIMEEERARAKGYQNRVKALTQAKGRAEAIEKMVEAQSMEDLFPAYQEEIRQIQGQSRNVDSGCCLM